MSAAAFIFWTKGGGRDWKHRDHTNDHPDHRIHPLPLARHPLRLTLAYIYHLSPNPSDLPPHLRNRTLLPVRHHRTANLKSDSKRTKCTNQDGQEAPRLPEKLLLAFRPRNHSHG